MKFCLIVGTRPQIIKSQPLINELRSKKSKLIVIHTGQHYDFEMSKRFFSELKIKDPDINLNIKNSSSSKQLSQIIAKLEKPLLDIMPDYIIVPGDTRSALGAALSANRLKIPLAHIEAGARSNDLSMEEEVNRRLIDHCSNVLFAPTKNCLNNLKHENVLGKSFFTGDTMLDVFIQFEKKLKLKKMLRDNSIFMTIHRQENLNNKNNLKAIINLAKKISKRGFKIIFPIHPHTKKQLDKFSISLEGISVTKPLTYSETLTNLACSKLVITDSGGLQKEAFWTNTSCLTIRKNTEWIETLNGNQLVTNIQKINVEKLLSRINKHLTKTNTNIFGNGSASKKIVKLLHQS